MDKVKIFVWTERFLGTRARGESLLALLETMDGGRWIPDKWGHFEPVRSPYSGKSYEAILSGLTEQRGGRIANTMIFQRQKPHALICATAWRGRVPDMNLIWLELEAGAFASADGVERLKKMVLRLVEWSQGVYATTWHTKQAHDRMAQKTPQERLKRMDWLTFFGEPYIELFGGKDRVLKTPCYRVEEVPDGLLLLAAPRPDSPEMTESADVLIGLEEYLGPDAFAGRGYPTVPCRVPKFDLSETVVAGLASKAGVEEKRREERGS